jgi:hypothetical protein
MERLVVNALFNLEAPYRFGGISGFVNVSRHRRNLLAEMSTCRFFSVAVSGSISF